MLIYTTRDNLQAIEASSTSSAAPYRRRQRAVSVPRPCTAFDTLLTGFPDERRGLHDSSLPRTGLTQELVPCGR